MSDEIESRRDYISPEDMQTYNRIHALLRSEVQLFVDSNNLHKDDAAGLVKNLILESDRGCVPVAADIIDGALKSLLRTRFRKSCPEITPDEEKRLLSDPSETPLLNTTVKIRLAHALGMLPKYAYEMGRSLLAVRSGKFAHDSAAKEISESHLQSIEKHLPESVRKEMMRLDAAAVAASLPGVTENRAKFINLAAIVLHAIHDAEKRITNSGA